MASLHQKVRRTITRYALLPPGSRVLAAVSGGADSVALVLLLRDLAEPCGFTLSALAHLNHRLRASADRDERFCRELARELELPLVVEAADVGAYARSQRLSVEDAARRVRYDFLRRAAEQSGATRVAVGHTLDDQAETFLLKLIRGAGGTGLGGIYPMRGPVVRPLIDVSREELERFLRLRNQGWVEDETNLDLSNPRNRIRHVVLPELDRAYGGPTRPAIARAARLIREDAQWLDEVADRKFESLTTGSGGELTIEVSALQAEPAPLRRRVLLRALRHIARGREVGFSHVETAQAVLTGDCPAADIPGGRLERREGTLVFSPSSFLLSPSS